MKQEIKEKNRCADCPYNADFYCAATLQKYIECHDGNHHKNVDKLIENIVEN